VFQVWIVVAVADSGCLQMVPEAEECSTEVPVSFNGQFGYVALALHT
jgi:hypothetical protein